MEQHLVPSLGLRRHQLHQELDLCRLRRFRLLGRRVFVNDYSSPARGSFKKLLSHNGIQRRSRYDYPLSGPGRALVLTRLDLPTQHP